VVLNQYLENLLYNKKMILLVVKEWELIVLEINIINTIAIMDYQQKELYCINFMEQINSTKILIFLDGFEEIRYYHLRKRN